MRIIININKFENFFKLLNFEKKFLNNFLKIKLKNSLYKI